MSQWVSTKTEWDTDISEWIGIIVVITPFVIGYFITKDKTYYFEQH